MPPVSTAGLFIYFKEDSESLKDSEIAITINDYLRLLSNCGRIYIAANVTLQFYS